MSLPPVARRPGDGCRSGDGGVGGGTPGIQGHDPPDGLSAGQGDFWKTADRGGLDLAPIFFGDFESHFQLRFF